MDVLKSKAILNTTKTGSIYHTVLCHTRSIPPIFSTFSVESVDSILSYIEDVSHQTTNLSQQQHVSNLISQQKEAHEYKLRQQENDHEKEMKKMQRDLEKFRSEAESAIKAAEILQSQLASSQKTILETLETRFKEEKKEIESKHKTDLERQKDFETRMNQKLEKDLDHERSQNAESRKKISELEEKIANKRLQLANSSNRGATGEQDFKDLVKDLKGWDLIHTSSQKDAMDFSFDFKGIEIRFDTKNHESSVIPESDVVKVRKDLRHHPETDCGILVAMHREVMYNKRKIEEITIEWTATQQLLIIIPKFLSHDLPLTLTWLETIFGCIKPYRKILKENDLNYEVALTKEREKNISVASILEVSVNDITEHIKNLNRDKRTAMQQINLMASNAESAFYSSMSRMKSMVDILKDEAIETDPILQPQEAKKKRAPKKKELIIDSKDV